MKDTRTFDQKFGDYIDFWKREASTTSKVFFAVCLTAGAMAGGLGALVVLIASWYFIQIEMRHIIERREVKRILEEED